MITQETKATMSPAGAENIAYWSAKCEETKLFLQRNPDPRLSAGARDLLSEYESKLERAKYDAEHPAPPEPVAPTPALISEITNAVLALMPEIVGRVVVELQKK